MTSLQITPNWKNKTARFKGTIAAGEHVAVRIVNDDGEGDEYIKDATNLRLRVVNPANGKTLAQFPMPEVLPTVALEDEEETEGTEATEEDAETWGGLTPLTCELNLNTDRMLMAVPPGANVQLLFVLDAYEGATDEDDGEFTLYFKDMCEVTHWPRRRGEDEPTRLDDYKDLIADFREDIYGEGGFKERVESAEANAASAANAAQSAAQSASAANTGAWAAANAAQVSSTSAWDAATAATGAATDAASAKTDAIAARTAAEVAQTAAETAQGKAEDAQAAAEAARDAINEPTDDFTEEGVAVDAKAVGDALDLKADKATTYTKTQTDTKITDAISAVKNSAPEAFDTLKEIADWIQDDQSGAAAMAETISSHTSQLTQLSQNKVDKVAGKGLSANDYTTADKEKLSGVEAGAKDNVVEAASASAFPQTGVTGKIYVAKDENKTYRWDGSQYMQVGGSSVTIDGTLSVPGAAADAKATGDALAGKLSKAEAEAGFTEWVCAPPMIGDERVYIEWDGSYWTPTNGDGKSGVVNGNATSTNLTWEANDWWGGVSLTATRTRLPTMADIPTKTSDLTNDSGFLTQHQQLTPVYSQTPTFSEWTILRDDEDVTSRVEQPAWDDDFLVWDISILSGDATDRSALPGAADATALHWIGYDIGDNYKNVYYTATRTRTDVVGYTLGSQTTKPLQPQGDYATISALRYAIVDSQTSYSTTDSDGDTATVHLSDRAMNVVSLGEGVSYATLVFPAKTAGLARDFFVRLTITGADVPTLYFKEQGGASVAFDVDDDSWAEIEQGVNVLMFNDTSEASA